MTPSDQEIFDILADVRQKLALWRCDYNNVMPSSSRGNNTPTEARQALELVDDNATAALAQPEADNYQPQGLSV